MKTTDSQGYFAYSILVTLMFIGLSLHTGMMLKRYEDTKQTLVICLAQK